MRFEDLTGKRFDRLIVLEQVPNIGKYTAWRCLCDCGNEKIAKSVDLKRGHTKSCGCLNREGGHFTHGMSDGRLYRIWHAMRNRCNNQNSPAYKYYGDRGIHVCEEWENSFESFMEWSLKNGYKENLTIDRIDNNGEYNPSNCRWVSMAVQNKNKRNSLSFTFNGQTKSISELSKTTGIHYQTLIYRIKTGMPPERVLAR